MVYCRAMAGQSRCIMVAIVSAASPLAGTAVRHTSAGTISPNRMNFLIFGYWRAICFGYRLRLLDSPAIAGWPYPGIVKAGWVRLPRLLPARHRIGQQPDPRIVAHARHFCTVWLGGHLSWRGGRLPVRQMDQWRALPDDGIASGVRLCCSHVCPVAAESHPGSQPLSGMQVSPAFVERSRISSGDTIR